MVNIVFYVQRLNTHTAMGVRTLQASYDERSFGRFLMLQRYNYFYIYNVNYC